MPSCSHYAPSAGREQRAAVNRTTGKRLTIERSAGNINRDGSRAVPSRLEPTTQRDVDGSSLMVLRSSSPVLALERMQPHARP